MAAAGGDLPPGYRFYPTEEELICFYLRNKLDNLRDDIERVIPVVDVYSVDPPQLPEIHEMMCGGAGEGDETWFYFCPRQEREARGGRPSRTTPSGYWKAAGTPGVVYSSSDRRAIGMKKTMVFYRGRAPSGAKTKWKMNEYRALQYYDAPTPAAAAAVGNDGSSSTSNAHAAAAHASANVPPPQLRSEFSLCRLYTKSGTLRQFDRRPLAAAAGVVPPGEEPGPSTAAAASSPPDDDDGSMQQQHQQLGIDAGDPYGDDVAILDALLYWPGD
nr:unnamed protein product [Digitaria exilis]